MTVWLVRIWTYKNANEKAHTISRKSINVKKRILCKFTYKKLDRTFSIVIALLLHPLSMFDRLSQGSATCSPRAKSGPPTHFIRPAASFRNCVFIRPATSLRNYDNQCSKQAFGDHYLHKLHHASKQLHDAMDLTGSLSMFYSFRRKKKKEF